MYVQIANPSLSCSTLMLGCFSENMRYSGAHTYLPINLRINERFPTQVEVFIHDILKFVQSNRSTYLSGYDFTDFAFCTASTQQSQTHVEQILTDFGFFHTRRVQKLKNPNNECIFWVIEMPEFVERLRKVYDESAWLQDMNQSTHYAKILYKEIKDKHASPELQEFLKETNGKIPSLNNQKAA